MRSPLRLPNFGLAVVLVSAISCGVEGPIRDAKAEVAVGCADSVYGALEDGWQARSVILGPISFVGMREARTQPVTAFEPRNGRYSGWKQLVRLEEGARAFVSVPKADRRSVSLLYGARDRAKSLDGTFAVSDGASSVELVACRAGESPEPEKPRWAQETFFAGGLIVAGARCVRLDVTVIGGSEHRIEAPFAIDSC